MNARCTQLLILTLSGALFAACGESGSTCSVTPNADGTSTLSCTDGTSVVIRNGADGEDGTPGSAGTSCTVAENADTGNKTITCGATSINVEDGTVCTLVEGTGSRTLTCGGASTTIVDGTSCTVATNSTTGAKTISCSDGTTVTVTDGADGTDSVSPGDPRISQFHGINYLTSSGYFATAGKFMANVQITAASVNAEGKPVVEFTVKNESGAPYAGLTAISGAAIVKLVPPSGTKGTSDWVSYIYRTETVPSTGSYPNPAETKRYQATRESGTAGVLTNNGDGSYKYVFGTKISDGITLPGALPDGTTSISYQPELTHRVSIMMGGRSGPTASPHFDFRPDGQPVTERRDIVATSTCKKCHGPLLQGHGGDRITNENCVTCHVPGSEDANGGQSVDMKVMIHKIHMGGELASTRGADGKAWDDPSTTADESADNNYAIWGNGNTKHSWRGDFPAKIDNCTVCHEGNAAQLPQVDNWKTKPTRAACESCHEDLSTNTTHNTIAAGATDATCISCHAANNPTIGVEAAHNHALLEADQRNIPEFTPTITLSAPANGQYFVAGEAPVVSIVLRDDENGGATFDHSKMAYGAATATSTCTSATACPPRTVDSNGNTVFGTASFFVHGPRANRNPVLTTAARAQILSPSPAPANWDLSWTGAAPTLVLKVDQGADTYSAVGGSLQPGTITVTGTAAINKVDATAADIVGWLNANAAFKARAIAFVQDGRVGIRSRNLGKVYAIQLQSSVIATKVFAGDTAVKVPGGYYPSNNLVTDPKATRTAEAITYQLDPVDDLQPGTYVASIEITARGRYSATVYKIPSVAKVTFKVKTATAEPLIADNCNACHQSSVNNKGLVLDPSRHNKLLDNAAVDQCGACHDYQPQTPTGSAFAGGKAISKRVHAVHNGSNLTYPLATVDYSNGDPVAGRNWNITFPQDIRNCESCHTADTSGTWKTNPNRLACSGCHDSDAATAHIKSQTYDPTPTDPWSGDEQESCATCH